MLTLYENAFSPFARKVKMVLEYKGLEFNMVDGLTRDNHRKLAAVNKRLEVPALDHQRCRETQLFANDIARTKAYLADPSKLDIEREKIFWRGDRIEWILARGYHDWFLKEIEEGRILWPQIGVPT